jgi:hypothetical protein
MPHVESKLAYGMGDLPGKGDSKGNRTRTESLTGIIDFGRGGQGGEKIGPDRTKNSDGGLPGNLSYGNSSNPGSSSKKYHSSSKNVSKDSIDST